MVVQRAPLQDLLLLELEVLATVLSLTPTRNIILPAYSNVRAEVNQISRLQFCACANSPVPYKNEENQCTQIYCGFQSSCNTTF